MPDSRKTIWRGIVLLVLLLGAGIPSVRAEAGITCPDRCSGHGACQFEGLFNKDRQGWPWSRICYCDPGWAGENCSRCTSDDACPGRQVCRFGACRCRTGWQGDACDRCYSSVACGKNGSCSEERCVCDPGWTGTDCDARLEGSVVEEPPMGPEGATDGER